MQMQPSLSIFMLEKINQSFRKERLMTIESFALENGNLLSVLGFIYYLNSMRTCNLDIRRYLVIVLGMKKHHKMIGPHSEC